MVVSSVSFAVRTQMQMVFLITNFLFVGSASSVPPQKASKNDEPCVGTLSSALGEAFEFNPSILDPSSPVFQTSLDKAQSLNDGLGDAFAFKPAHLIDSLDRPSAGPHATWRQKTILDSLEKHYENKRAGSANTRRNLAEAPRRNTAETLEAVVQAPRFTPRVIRPLRGTVARESEKDKLSILETTMSLDANAKIFHSICTWREGRLKTKQLSQKRAHTVTAGVSSQKMVTAEGRLKTNQLSQNRAHTITAEVSSQKMVTAGISSQKIAAGELSSQIFGLCVLLAFCAAFAWWAKRIKFWSRYREIVPGIGKWLRRLGIDKYDKFEVNIIIGEVTYHEKLNSYVRLEAEFNYATSQMSKRGPSHRVQGSMAAIFDDPVALVVPQGAMELKVKLLDELQTTTIAEGTLPLETIFKADKDDLVVQLLRKGKKAKKMLEEDPKVILTVYYKEGEAEGKSSSDSDSGPDLLEGLDTEVLSLGLKLEIQKQSNRIAKDAGLLGAGQMLSRKQLYQHQLQVIANTCAGNLSLARGFCTSPKVKWFSVFQASDDVKAATSDKASASHQFLSTWKLGWWANDKHSDAQTKIQKKTAPESAILVLFILKIMPDPNKSEEFVIEYVEEEDDLEQTQRLSLICGEGKSREYWVECLSVFINHLRKVRHDVKHKGKEANTSTSEEERHEKHKSHHSHKGEDDSKGSTHHEKKSHHDHDKKKTHQ